MKLRMVALSLVALGFVRDAERAHGVENEPPAGERREMRFLGEGGEECTIAFRWCPSGFMKDGAPDDPKGVPNAEMEGFWISETEVSQREYRIIAGTDAMESAKAYVLDNVAQPVPDKPADELTANDRLALEERETTERQRFSDDMLPVYGIGPADAEALCSKVGEAYDRFRVQSGRGKGFATFLFRLPAHFEWQYACRGPSRRKHFVLWPDKPASIPVGDFANYIEFFRKNDPDVYAEHEQVLQSFDGSEERMVMLLNDPATHKDVRALLEEVVKSFVPSTGELRRVADETPNGWNIRGMVANVAEWVFVVEDATPDRSTFPSPGDFGAGKSRVTAAYAGAANSLSGKGNTWQHLSIWHWQNEKTYTYRQQHNVRGQTMGVRIVMMDAVSEKWFSDLRELAEKIYVGEIPFSTLEDAYNNGVEVSARDKEGRSVASARIGIYGALAKARAGEEKQASKLLMQSVTDLKATGDDFFAQIEPLIEPDDLRN